MERGCFTSTSIKLESLDGVGAYPHTGIGNGPQAVDGVRRPRVESLALNKIYKNERGKGKMVMSDPHDPCASPVGGEQVPWAWSLAIGTARGFIP